MENAKLLVVAMATGCRDLLLTSEQVDTSLPQALQPAHLLWMSHRIEEQAETWPLTRLHRWIGFIQCGMMANRMLDLDGAKAMFRDAKVAFQPALDDQDLLDHLDPGSSFQMDIGGQG